MNAELRANAERLEQEQRDRARQAVIGERTRIARELPALRAGASGFLLKDTPAAQLTGALRMIAAGDALLAPGITRRLIEEFTNRARLAAAPGTRRTHRPRA